MKNRASSALQLQCMKKITSIVLLTCLCKLSYAQVVIALLFGDKLNTGTLEFGIVVTPGSTDISSIVSKRRDNLSLGIYFNIHPDKKFFIHAEGIAKGSFGAENLIPYPVGNDTLDALFASGAVERKRLLLTQTDVRRIRSISADISRCVIVARAPVWRCR